MNVSVLKCNAQWSVLVSKQSTGQKVIEVIVELSALINNPVKPLQVYCHHYVMWSRKSQEVIAPLREKCVCVCECVCFTVAFLLARDMQREPL